MSSTGTTMPSSISLVLGRAAMLTGRCRPGTTPRSSAGRTVADRPIRWAWPVRVQRVQPFQGQGQVRATLVPGQGVHFVHDHPRPPRNASRAFEVSSRNNDSGVVIRMSGGLVASLCAPRWWVSPVRTATWMSGFGRAHGLRGVPDPGQRSTQVPLDVHRQCLQRGDVQHPQRFRVPRGGGHGQPVQRPQERGQRLARPGRRDDQGRPLPIADQAWAWAGVGAANAAENQSRVMALKPSRVPRLPPGWSRSVPGDGDR